MYVSLFKEMERGNLQLFVPLASEPWPIYMAHLESLAANLRNLQLTVVINRRPPEQQQQQHEPPSWNKMNHFGTRPGH